VAIRFVSVVGGEIALLDAAVEHYRELGVESFHIARHVESLEDPEFERSVMTLARHGLRFAAVHQGPWDEDLNAYLIRAQMRRHPDDWWVVADLDEFHVYDRKLTDIVAACEANGCDYVRGAFLDRVSLDGSLAPLDSTASVWEQYPLAGLVTLRVLKAVTSKVTLARGHVQLHPGQHWALSGRPLPATEAFAQVHHFKWTDSVLRRLLRRVDAYSSGDWYLTYPAVTEESRRFLRHLEEHGGRMDVDAADLMVRPCGNQYLDYAPWPEAARMLSLRDGLVPNTAPTEEELQRLLATS
jgi:hypothetical protein